MKKLLPASSVFLLCLGLFSSIDALGHEGGHVLTTEQAMSKAARAVGRLIDKGESIGPENLDDSWKQVTATGECKENSEHYIISFNNRKLGKTLYVLLTIEGAYKRSNFDGTFSDLTFSPYPLQDCN